MYLIYKTFVYKPNKTVKQKLNLNNLNNLKGEQKLVGYSEYIKYIFVLCMFSQTFSFKKFYH